MVTNRSRNHCEFQAAVPQAVFAFILREYEADKNPQKTVNVGGKSSTRDKGCLGNVGYNRHNPEMLVEIDLHQEACT
jgi:hypothetical protein